MEISQEVYDEADLNAGERLQTEYIDEEESEIRYSAIRSELISWIHLEMFIMIGFFTAAICLLLDYSLLLILIPHAAYDIYMIYLTIQLLRSQTEKYDKFNHIKNLIERISSLLGAFAIILAVLLHAYYSFVAVFLGLLAQIVRFVLRRRDFYECQNFSKMFFFQFRWMKILMILSVGLKVQRIVKWEWISVFWPVWVGLSLSCILSLGVLLLSLGAIFSWISKESSNSELISTLWLLYATLGGTLSFGTFAICAVWTLDNDMGKKDLGSITIIPVIFLATLMVFTYLHIEELVEWWDSFFTNDADRQHVVPDNHEFVMAHPETTSPEPLHTRSLSSQFLTILKNQPKVLVRLSSTYYKPADREFPPKKRHYRALSTSTHGITARETHRRVVSSATTQDRRQLLEDITPRFDSEVPTKVCFMCDEHISDAVLMECGHGGLCHACALQLWKTTSQCHLCRSPISHVLKIELPSSNYVKILATTELVRSSSETERLPEILEVPEFM